MQSWGKELRFGLERCSAKCFFGTSHKQASKKRNPKCHHNYESNPYSSSVQRSTVLPYSSHPNYAGEMSKPTYKPTKTPSRKPSAKPTPKAPTFRPSPRAPSFIPTKLPTFSPTFTPSYTPTFFPTGQPSSR